jgi:hypothetical protein
MKAMNVHTALSRVKCNANSGADTACALAAQRSMSARMPVRLMRHAESGEYLCVPVVHADPDNHFAGFRPDRLRALADPTAA